MKLLLCATSWIDKALKKRGCIEVDVMNSGNKKGHTCEILFPISMMDDASDAAFSWPSFCSAIPTSATAKEGASFIPSPTLKKRRKMLISVKMPFQIIDLHLSWQPFLTELKKKEMHTIMHKR